VDVAQILAFNVALLVAMASPGPALLVLTHTALSAGRVRALWTGCGLACVAALWTLAALLGLEALFTLFPAAYGVMKTAGALYLIYIARATWRSARAPLADAPQVSARGAFRRGAAINLLNPKSVLFSAGVLVVIFPPDLGVGAVAFITLNHLAVEIAVYALLVTALARPGARRAYVGAKTWLDRVCAVVLGGLGLRLLAERAP
jgi:threonine/homoserine/homoserine lactone efflux protein